VKRKVQLLGQGPLPGINPHGLVFPFQSSANGRLRAYLTKRPRGLNLNAPVRVIQKLAQFAQHVSRLDG
jgi:hypothetical protein